MQFGCAICDLLVGNGSRAIVCNLFVKALETSRVAFKLYGLTQIENQINKSKLNVNKKFMSTIGETEGG